MYAVLERTYEKLITLPQRRPLPTMYDLPSENPEDPGLPDVFHIYQPQLLEETFLPPFYPPERFFVATDLNLYYDVNHPTWYKRPDWFVALRVPRLYKGRDMRMSYVIWQEKEPPFMVVELLSESTKKEDLGKTTFKKIPTKWQVYEKILRIPYYIVFSRDPDEFRAFQRGGRRFREIFPENGRLWLLELNLGLGLWHGNYKGIERQWLRWYDANGKWIPIAEEKARIAEEEKQRAEEKARQAEEKEQEAMQLAAQLAAQLKALGV